MLKSLTDDEHGCYVVETASGSSYTVNFGTRNVRRVAGEAAGERLRRDGDDVDLVEVVQCVLGRPLLLLLDLGVPGIWLTRRESTRVVGIDPVPQRRGRGVR